MHRFKSAILAKMKNCQNGTFEPVHEIQKFFWPKAFFWNIMKIFAGVRNYRCILFVTHGSKSYMSLMCDSVNIPFHTAPNYPNIKVQ